MENIDKENKAFLAAYDEYSDAIFRFCVIKTRDRELALDIAQDTFMKTWEYLNSGKQVDNIRAFLYRVARNLIIDHSRKKKTSSLDKLTEDGFDFGFDENERVVDTIDGRQAIEMLEELPEKYRDVLVMRYVEDMNIGEIAESLQESENTVSVRIHRGMKKAQTLFQEKQLVT